MKRQILRVEAQGVDALQLVRQAPAKDAQLQTALVYLIVASHGDGLVPLDQLAQAHNVSDWTAARWVKALAEKELLTLRRLDEGLVLLTVAGADPSKSSQDALQREGAIPAQSEVPTPVTAPSRRPDSAPSDNLGPIRAARLNVACDLLETCPNISKRLAGQKRALRAMFEDVVKNPMFTQVDLPKEILDADAWLTQQRSSYTNMVRFLTNWLRRAAKEKAGARNANPTTPGKYKQLAAHARGEGV